MCFTEADIILVEKHCLTSAYKDD